MNLIITYSIIIVINIAGLINVLKVLLYPTPNAERKYHNLIIEMGCVYRKKPYEVEMKHTDLL